MDTHYHEAYWELLLDLRGQIQYLHLHQVGFEKMQNRLNIYLAIAASVSIASWAVWKQLPFLWAGIIAGSQVVHAIKPFLPWERNLKNVRGAKADFEMLHLDAERSWYNVREGKFTTEEIHALTMDVKANRIRINQKYFGSSALPHRQGLYEKAYKHVEETMVQG